MGEQNFCEISIDNNEIWKPVNGYEGLYDISNLGRVRSYCNNKHGIKNKPKIIKGLYGVYNTMLFCKEGIRKTFYVHRLVAEAFIPNPNKLPEVNHIDGNKRNNAVTNLEWVTHEGNMCHASRSGLFGQQKKVLCVEDHMLFSSITAAGKSIGFSQPKMSKAIHKKKPLNGKTYIILEEK